MRYLPISDQEKKEIIDSLNIDSVEELFESIPEELRFNGELDLPAPLAENELEDYFKSLAEKNTTKEEFDSFLGAGAYHHFIPSMVSNLIQREEFYTSYTPYQSEISQGTLQSIFEFQTLVSQLTGLDISNASLYDGSTATAEAAIMADRIKRKRNRVIISKNVHPQYRKVLKTYIENLDIELVEIPFENQSGRVDLNALKNKLDDNVSSIIVQSPNFFGSIEELGEISNIAHKNGALFTVVVNEPFSLGLLKPPGEYGADIAVGEMQGFGNSLNFGGPYLGFLACKDKYKRKIPGRIVGKTKSQDGKTGYVLTLSTREQHIRRERATSNICTNQALCALAATITLTCLGKKGIRKLAELNLRKAHYLADKIKEIKSCDIAFKSPFFNEFTVRTESPANDLVKELKKKSIISGYTIGDDYPEMQHHLLINATEMTSQDTMDNFLTELEAYSE